MSVVKFIVYLHNERKNLNKNATHKERHILRTVNFRFNEGLFHILHYVQRYYPVSGIHYYKTAISLLTSCNYAKKFLI
jgi:hypothetical protein